MNEFHYYNYYPSCMVHVNSLIQIRAGWYYNFCWTVYLGNKHHDITKYQYLMSRFYTLENLVSKFDLGTKPFPLEFFWTSVDLYNWHVIVLVSQIQCDMCGAMIFRYTNNDNTSKVQWRYLLLKYRYIAQH